MSGLSNRVEKTHPWQGISPKLFCTSSVNLEKHAYQEKFMNRALVPITAAVFTSLTWAQSQTPSTSQNGSRGGVQTFRRHYRRSLCSVGQER